MKDTEDSVVATTSPREEDAAIRVMIVDDHEVVRQGLRTIFRAEPDISVVGEAASNAACLDKVKELIPDVILLDIKMPDGDGFLAANEIRRRFPSIKVIMLTGYENNLYISEAINLGVSGFITKNCPKRLLLNSIRVVMDGGSVWEGESLYNAMRSLHQLSKIEVIATTNIKPTVILNPREIEVAKLIIDGQTNQGIAVKLGVPTGTVKKSIRNIMNTLGVSKRTQVAVAASRMNLV